MRWEVCLSWYLAGSVLGLTIAQIMVSDDELSGQILFATMILLALNLILLLYVVIKDIKCLN